MKRRDDTRSMCSLRGRGVMLAALGVVGLFMAGGPCAWGAMPPRGSDAPAIHLKDLDGREVRTGEFGDRVLIVVFGEVGHEGVARACADVLDVAADPRVEHDSVVPILIVARAEDAGAMKEDGARERYPAIVLLDPTREAFGAFKVLVVPSVVVVDGQGKVTHAMPGFLPRFKEILLAAVQVATGKAPEQKLDEALTPAGAQEASPEATRAARLTRLGAELARHGLLDMAEARYAEAIALAPHDTQAKLGLADLMVRRERGADAEPLFRSVLATQPDSVDARLGLAAVALARGGESAAGAEPAVAKVLESDPSNARAHYLMGRILEARAEGEGALREYRKAAELLLVR